ncbi:MAG: hypothetical protein ACO1OB_11755 [Archangium sp.]
MAFIDSFRTLLIRTAHTSGHPMMDWQRKRHPEDVPTPVAVALSDFCRRAKSPASPGLVRDALALLSDSDDARVREFADSEPTEKLGPFGVVDVLRGTTVKVAAERQAAGFYEDIRRKAEDSAVPELLEASEEVPAAPKAPLFKPKDEKPKKGRPSMKDKIAPLKRKAGDKVERALPQQPLPGTAFLPKRNLPAPRGRFTTVDPTRASFESLFRSEGKETLETLIAQVPHRVALLRTLEQGYVGRRGSALSVGDVEDLLEAHELFDVIEKKERDGVLAAIIEAKGALGRAAHGFGLKPDELEKLAGALGLEREIEQVRDRFIKEALAPQNLSLRLDLLFRGKYLDDLGIERRFVTSLTRELTSLIDEVKEAATTVPTLVDMVSRQHALHAESLRRALEKLGLLEPWLKDAR